MDLMEQMELMQDGARYEAISERGYDINVEFEGDNVQGELTEENFLKAMDKHI